MIALPHIGKIAMSSQRPSNSFSHSALFCGSPAAIHLLFNSSRLSELVLQMSQFQLCVMIEPYHPDIYFVRKLSLDFRERTAEQGSD